MSCPDTPARPSHRPPVPIRQGAAALARLALWALFGLAGAAQGQEAGPPLPYSPAVAARFPEPATRYDAPVLAPGALGFTTDEALAAQLAAVVAAAPAGTRIERLQPGRSQGGVALEALWLHRSWTALCIYVIRFAADGDHFVITGVTVNRDPTQYTGTDSHDLVALGNLLDSVLSVSGRGR